MLAKLATATAALSLFVSLAQAKESDQPASHEQVQPGPTNPDWRRTPADFKTPTFRRAPMAGQPQTEAAESTNDGLWGVERRIIEQTNSERTQRGLSALQVDYTLVSSARKHATWMTNANTLQHTSAPVAENIAMGQNNSREAMNAWMNSSGHRANILNPGYRRIGVAAFRGRHGVIYWCQQFLR